MRRSQRNRRTMRKASNLQKGPDEQVFSVFISFFVKWRELPLSAIQSPAVLDSLPLVLPDRLISFHGTPKEKIKAVWIDGCSNSEGGKYAEKCFACVCHYIAVVGWRCRASLSRASGACAVASGYNFVGKLVLRMADDHGAKNESSVSSRFLWAPRYRAAGSLA
jgi:hypothetical protein